ncbi:MAG: nitroreductase family protein [Bacteroidales bacterium]|nr:nitroreductase family protein [Bacteroidales bacterium]
MIAINPTNCTRCYRCVKVCPSNIFSISKDDKSVQIKNENRCIGCGHCVSACADHAVIHSDFPNEKVHKIDGTKCATPEQTMLLIRKRRSNRVFSSNPIPQEFLSQIIEAAHRAPTAKNLQNLEFTVITDPEKLKTIIEFTLKSYLSQIKFVDNFLLRPIFKRCFPDVYKYVPMFRKMQEIYIAKGKDVGILRGATALLLIHTSQSLDNSNENSQLAYQNASLMAESLGVSQFYTGFIIRVVKKRHQKLEKILGINGKIHAGMALGMPQFEFPNYVDRKEIRVTYL